MSDVVLVALIGGIVTVLTAVLSRLGNKKYLDKIAEGTKLGLENDIVIFDAFRRNKINGESEQQEQKMREYFLHTTTDSFYRTCK